MGSGRGQHGALGSPARPRCRRDVRSGGVTWRGSGALDGLRALAARGVWQSCCRWPGVRAGWAQAGGRRGRSKFVAADPPDSERNSSRPPLRQPRRSALKPSSSSAPVPPRNYSSLAVPARLLRSKRPPSGHSPNTSSLEPVVAATFAPTAAAPLRPPSNRLACPSSCRRSARRRPRPPRPRPPAARPRPSRAGRSSTTRGWPTRPSSCQRPTRRRSRTSSRAGPSSSTRPRRRRRQRRP